MYESESVNSRLLMLAAKCEEIGWKRKYEEGAYFFFYVSQRSIQWFPLIKLQYNLLRI